MRYHGSFLTAYFLWITLARTATASETGTRKLQKSPSSSDRIAVHIVGGIQKAETVALENGLKFAGQIGSLKDYYLLEHTSRRKRSTTVQSLSADPDVLWFELQQPLTRTKRDFLNIERRLPVPRPTISDDAPWRDPFYRQEWYLRKGGRGGWDMNVENAWRRGFSGKGVVVSILDDGLQWNHPDISQNYDHLASLDINGNDFDPTPTDDGQNKHGTRCAGVVAAVGGNGVCGVGVAFNASIGGVRVLDGEIHDSTEAAAISFNSQHIDIYSASWGPEDSGKALDGPGRLAQKAFEDGVRTGRKGLGSIFVWASGNGGKDDDSCSCDGYASSIYTISVSSAAQDGSKPWYLEECSSTLTTTYSSGNSWQPSVITTDLNTPGNFFQACTNQHTGTSASAPMAAGVLALALEANRNLTWRDLQYLIVLSSNPEPLMDDWVINSLGRRVSNKFGYGLLDADRLVQLAMFWESVGEHHKCQTSINRDLRRSENGRTEVDIPTDGCFGTPDTVRSVEHVQAIVTIQAPRRGNIVITLISPRGTPSNLLPRRSQDDDTNGFFEYPFSTVHFWGEDPVGTWRLIVEYSDPVQKAPPSILLTSWSLIFYGVENVTKVVAEQFGMPLVRTEDVPAVTQVTQQLTVAKIVRNSAVGSFPAPSFLLTVMFIQFYISFPFSNFYMML
ncbi:hypothetical protein RvY_07175 [Ramazzottius varieornatus]|uniref:P/Homo B domain-containing protein n=1 Tax=Ramazzottius varieornatus TaxID=947166 RepID=A0A1D1V7C2_RAMVA|nr:hypothetical protein RvY_07175 [Ramazzottius varieornatus]